MEKNLQWKCVMIGAVLFMIAGFALSLWAIDTGYTDLIYIGLFIIATVCVSWWLWVMIVIKTLLTNTTKTTKNLNGIKEDLSKVKSIIKSIVTAAKR